MSDDRKLTADDVRVPMGGAIHFVARIVPFRIGEDKVSDRKVVELWRSGLDGSEHRFATIYRHECGEVAVTVDRQCCIRLGTMLDHVVPAMNQFEEFVGHIPQLPGSPMAGAAIICSLGSCEKCRGGSEARIVSEMKEFHERRLCGQEPTGKARRRKTDAHAGVKRPAANGRRLAVRPPKKTGKKRPAGRKT